MNRIVVLGLAAACLAPAPAAAATRHWRMSAELSGAYANDVTGTARCAAAFREEVSGLHVRFASRALRYDTQARVLTGPLTYRITGGRWAVTGSYVPQLANPDGTLRCADAPTPVACDGAIVGEDGGRTASTGAARLGVDDNTRREVVSRIVAPRLTEEYADAGTPPASWPSVCRNAPDDESVLVGPLFGLSVTAIADRALGARIRMSAARLAGRRAFRVAVAASRPSGCPAQGLDPCTERGGFALRVAFRPAR